MAASARLTTWGTLKQPADDDEALTFTASSESVNRYGFALRNSGWRLDNWNVNPVVLYQHLDFVPPIGRGRASLRDSQLVAAITFDRADPFAAMIEGKYRAGVMNAVSVGFDFVDKSGKTLANWWSLTPEQIRDEAFYDLAEISTVSVPADPKAVRQHHAALATAGLELLDLAGWVRQGGMLTPPQGDAPFLSPPQAPVLPGNADADRRLALLETDLARLRATMAAIPAHTTAVENSAWDGPAAVSGMAAEKVVLRYCHAWVDPDADADAKSSYKFPHHRSNGGPANLAACRNAMSRLPQADIPEADRAGVERHIQRHLDAATDDGFTPDAVQGLLAAIRL